MSLANPINEHEIAARQGLKETVIKLFAPIDNVAILASIHKRLIDEDNPIVVQLEVLLERMKEKERLEMAVRNGFHT